MQYRVKSLLVQMIFYVLFFFFFNDTATTEIYTLSLHDALPISRRSWRPPPGGCACPASPPRDRKSTRLNSSHLVISYAVFCLKKKKKTKNNVHNLINQQPPLPHDNNVTTQ